MASQALPRRQKGPCMGWRGRGAWWEKASASSWHGRGGEGVGAAGALVTTLGSGQGLSKDASAWWVERIDGGDLGGDLVRRVPWSQGTTGAPGTQKAGAAGSREAADERTPGQAFAWKRLRCSWTEWRAEVLSRHWASRAELLVRLVVAVSGPALGRLPPLCPRLWAPISTSCH